MLAAVAVAVVAILYEGTVALRKASPEKEYDRALRLAQEGNLEESAQHAQQGSIKHNEMVAPTVAATETVISGIEKSTQKMRKNDIVGRVVKRTEKAVKNGVKESSKKESNKAENKDSGKNKDSEQKSGDEK